MRVYIAVFALCIIAAILTSQPYSSSNTKQGCRPAQGQASPPTVRAENDKGESTTQTATSDGCTPEWYAPLQRSEWWLVIIAALTGLAIAYQAREMARATEEMRASTQVARDSFEAGINEKRARIKIDVGSGSPVAFNPDAQQLQTNMVAVTLLNYGQTIAYITDFRARFIRGDIGLEADFQDCRQFSYDESLAPNARSPIAYGVILEPKAGLLSEDEVMAIKKGETFLHFYAYVEYEDVYKRYRIQTRHVYWKMRWGGKFDRQIMEWWEPVGEPGENEDREYKPNPD
jgi:hypothetical protein